MSKTEKQQLTIKIVAVAIVLLFVGTALTAMITS